MDFVSRLPVHDSYRVLEVGSRIVKRTVRTVFPSCREYVGIDMIEGPGVDVILKAEDAHNHFGAESFDAVLCLETMEHVQHWRAALESVFSCVRTGGVFCMTTPTIEKGRHNYPDDYWRWTLRDYAEMFADQQIMSLCQVWKKGIGVMLKKRSNRLHLDAVYPMEVA